MKIILAKTAGFCYGVERAVRIAIELAQSAAAPVRSLGPIVHNPQVVGDLSRKGVKVVVSAARLRKGTVIVSAHGRTAAEIAGLKRRGVAVVDATCPNVLRAERLAAELAREGRVVVLLGDPNHPEVRAVASYAKGAPVIIAAGPWDLPVLKGVQMVGVVAQTTQKKARFDALVGVLRARVDNLRVFDTICSATKKRQEEAEKLSRGVDVMIVVGGRDSANTMRLAEICRKNCPRTFQIESAADLRALRFKKNDTVGVTAGASTPESVIKEVVERLKVSGTQRE
ncbi:MAG: 4-hydroxy-3-methylbut-2-enyl diphosphate reductase [Deltaproteobacteria bacterium]|nr:4-hydroxy-3-methylbut-2-enyl diphosphate reductase [Deltaproteobacteria bacterium]